MEPNYSTAWLILLAAINAGGLLITVIVFFLKLKHRNPSIESEFATKDELIRSEERLQDAMIRLDHNVGEKLDRLDDKRSDQLGKVYEGQRELQKSQARIEERTEHLDRDLNAIKSLLNQNHTGAG